VVDFYRAWLPMPYDAPSWDMTAALYVARPDAGFFQLSPPGIIQLSDSGDLEFAPAAEGKHHRLISDAAQRERIVQTFVEIASAKPVPRQSFRRQQKKAE